MKEELRKHIRNRLERYLAGEPSAWPGLSEQAQQLGALPIGLDLFTALFLTPDGTLYAWNIFEGGSAPQIVEDEIQRIAVLHVAAEWFPELKQAIPERPPEAEECATCCGTGTQLMTSASGNPKRYICFACRGVGWQTESLAQPPPS